MANERAQRFFGNDFRQNHVRAGIFEGRTGCGQAGCIRGVNVACTSQVLLLCFSVGFDRNRLVADVVGAEEVRQVQLGRGAGLDADGRAVQFLGRRHAQILRRHEALTVVVVHADEFELQVDIAREGPGGVPGQHVDFAGRQRGEAGLTGGRHEFNGRRVPKNSRSNSTAHGDVKAHPFAICVGCSKAHQTSGHATVQLATCLDVVKRTSGSSTSSQPSNCQCAIKYGFVHVYLFLVSAS